MHFPVLEAEVGASCWRLEAREQVSLCSWRYVGLSPAQASVVLETIQTPQR